MKMIKLFIVSCVMVGLMMNEVAAQSETTNLQNDNQSFIQYINPKIGVYASGSERAGYQAGVDLGMKAGKVDLSLGYNRMLEFSFSEPSELNQFNLLAGKNKETRLFSIQVLGGLSYLSGHLGGDRGDLPEEFERVSAFGIGGKLGLKYKITKGFALGLDFEGYAYQKEAIFIPSVGAAIRF